MNSHEVLSNRSKYKPISLRTIQILIDNTKQRKIRWICFSDIKKYLDNDGISIYMVPFFQDFLMFSHNRKHYPSKLNTFITFTSDRIYILSQNSYTLEYELCYCYSKPVEKEEWKQIIVPQILLMELSNVIRIVGTEKSNTVLSEQLYFINGVLALAE